MLETLNTLSSKHLDPHGDGLLQRAAVLLSCLLLLCASRLGAQHCDVHYRWQQKIDTTHLADTATATSIATVLTWASPPYSAASTYWCQPRNAREQKVYTLTGWARRMKYENSATGDFDWHIELTSARTTPVKKCIVVEIPPDTITPAYFNARQDFLAIITDSGSVIKNNGDVVPPVRLKITGLAFFDGEHRGTTGKPPHQHGRCNSKTSALWEIHPVYSIRAP